MSDRRTYDAVVIGAGVSGLAASAYLARAGRRVLLVEARDRAGGRCETVSLGGGYSAPAVAHTLYALDPRMTTELKLAPHGLRFAVRDMALVGLRHGGKHVVLTRDVRATSRSIALQANADAGHWPEFGRELLALARRMRALWWEPGACPRDPLLDRLRRTSVSAWLDTQFESDLLKATLAFDAGAVSPIEPDSALPLVWRAAQEMCGLQGAVAFPRGGPGAVVRALCAVVKRLDVETMTRAPAAAIVVENGAAIGVRLRSGESIFAPLIFSSLGRKRTLVDLAQGAGLGFGEQAALARPASPTASAKILLALDGLPGLGGIEVPTTGRYILAERLESHAAAHAAARKGQLPAEPVVEIVVASAADATLAPPGNHLMSILVRPVPRTIAGGWAAAKAMLAARVVGALERVFPGITRRITAAEILTPDTLQARYGEDDAGTDSSHLLADWPSQIATPLNGLYLCNDAGGVSGRAGRIAASLALRNEKAR